jgi:hypothetical protein
VASSLTVVASAVSLNLVETVVGLYWVRSYLQPVRW